MADNGEPQPEEIAMQSESDLLGEEAPETNGNEATLKEDVQSDQEDTAMSDTPVDGLEASDNLPTSENKDMTVDENSRHEEVSEEVFDFSSEHHFEDNDETAEEGLEADQVDEEKGHEEEKDGVEMSKDVEDDEEEEEDEEGDDVHPSSSDPNVMPEVNVTVLAQRKWQVKVYPLKPADFVSGQISRVFKNARESLLYLLSPGRNARGKGEMYISSASQAMRSVFSLMRLTFFYPEINVEIIKKNDEGSIEEKAYIRFDSKMTNLLTMGSFRVGPGRKRERLIGSVFVKNLPPGTTKDVLRVMFPFAQEINYNPEKFKDCTARLVLKSRNHVIPCLKAFAKVELGGNVLELHPLEKKKRVRTQEEDEGAPDAKHRKKSDDVKKEENVKKEETKKPDVKSPETKNAKQESAKDAKGDLKEKSDVKAGDSKEKKDTKPAASRTPMRRGGGRFGSGKKERYDQAKSYRPKLVGGQERSPRGPGVKRGGGRTDWASERGDRNKGRQERMSGQTRNFRDNDRNKGNRSQGRSLGRTSRGFGTARSMDRMNYGMATQGLGSTVSPSNANMAMNADATKEMVILQSQLSMAIKNQLAMLNQTQLAVEQAKRGASTLGIASDLPQTSRPTPKAFGAASGVGGYGKRSTDQHRRSQGDDSMDQQYSRSNRSRDRGMRASRGGQGGSGYGKRAAAYRDQMEETYYDVSSDMDHGADAYGRSSRDFAYERDINPDSFGSSGRSGYGQDTGGYSGYY